MQQSFSVSFPRSGHHLFVESLIRYFEIVHEPFGYCEYYSHCNTIPCTNPEKMFLKNHDFDLTLDNDNKNWKYIIQYRHPLESIVSWYKFQIERQLNLSREFNGLKKIKYWYFSRINKKYLGKDSYNEWQQFAQRKINFWKKFMDKWSGFTSGNYLYVSYADLINNFSGTLSNAVVFLEPSHILDLNAIKRVAQEKNVGYRNRIKDFKYYDEMFFKELEAYVVDELRENKITLYF